MKRLAILLFLPVFLIFFAMPASASYVLDLFDANFSGYSGPYVQVAIDLNDATHAVVTVQGLSSGGYYYLMGDGASFAANVNAGSFTVCDIIGTNTFSGFTPGSYSYSINVNKPKQVDGFGKFNLTINSFDGFRHSATQISFKLENISGTWTTASGVLALNAGDNLAASHIYVWDGTSANNEAGGYVGGASPVPVPGVVWLLGTSLAGLVGWRSRQRK